MTGITIDMYANDMVSDALSTIRIKTNFAVTIGYDELRSMRLLNEILTELDAASAALPYYYTASFNIEAGKQKYYLGQGEAADLAINFPVDIPYINIFNNAGSKYPVGIITDSIALSTMIQTNANDIFLPQQARVYKEQDPLGITYTVIDFLYPPDNRYEVQIRYKPSLSQLAVNSYITMLPAHMHTYIRLELAFKLSPYYGRDDSWSDILEKQRISAKELAFAANSVDLDVKSTNPLINSYRFYSSRLGVR